MIRELNIENFAIIESIHIDFDEGMTTLTGETGAGKSIIIDAIDQILGARSSSGLVKNGKSKAYIEAILDYNSNLDILLESYHIPIDDILTISKEINSNGKTICKVNYKTVSNAVLGKIGPVLIDIHSQFENHKLLDPKNDLANLDNFCKEELDDLLNQYSENYHHYLENQKEYSQLENQSESLEQLDFYNAQLEEINQFDFVNDSVDELEKEYDYMKNFEKINSALANFKQLMNNEQGIMDLLYEATDLLKIVDDHEDFKEDTERLNDLYFQIEDVKDSIIDKYDGLSFDEYHFNEVQEKLHLINKLKRKYGPGIDDILATKEDIEANIDILVNRDELLEECKQRIDHYMMVCHDIGELIHDKRVEAADQLSKDITSQLHSLYMEKSVFDIQVTAGELNQYGFDEVKFMISTNAGMALMPLGKIVSGGELSRIMLAMKTILLQKDPVETIIFDEVDTGVSGKVADAIGSKMKMISADKQVICITHLPQVASYATSHLYISKATADNVTSSQIAVLDEQERVIEIAKMLSGEQISEAALEQARNLLNKKA